ncbi:Crp/Fnr family transcriptional regulator [Sphingomonas sp. BT-65]|uniref:Crp/Fnr family transcriptional regulator n=1 Tax=Sphingomonas sp. BT-65 TaxID=2989821 RepID=UPI002235DF80|nr:Crp/Fnr family transcriptional regulator [Sphingomonas sp. BT-65]MCW4463456.1 Crp/Fnr family transcriptional regulator [Sphingomonas sp. BT-65]
MLNPLLAKLDSKMRLGPEERGALAALIQNRTHRLPARQDLYVEGDPTSPMIVILDGWACRYDQLADGRRQIVELFLPGDILGHDCLFAERQDHSACSISQLYYAQISRTDLDAAVQQFPALGRALLWDASVAAAIHRQWIRSLGRLSATQRIAHLFCELFYRSARAGLARGTAFDMPMGQRDLGDARGLSAVQVNRTVQLLRSAGLLGWRRRVVEITDLPRLATIAMFRPHYLDVEPAGERLASPSGAAAAPNIRPLPEERDLPLFR